MDFLNELLEIRKVALKEVDDTRATVSQQKLLEYVASPELKVASKVAAFKL